MIVQGPNLVRSVSLEGNIISILGDWLDTTALEVFSPRKISQVRFNGKEIHVKKSTYGSLVGTVTKNKESVTSVMEKLPALTQWKVADGLPERAGDYDDSKWTGKESLKISEEQQADGTNNKMQTIIPQSLQQSQQLIQSCMQMNMAIIQAISSGVAVLQAQPPQE